MGTADRISQLLLEQGRIGADALTQSAAASAGAQRANGQVWGQTLASLGHLPSEVSQQYQQQQHLGLETKRLGMEAQTEQLKNERLHQIMQGEQAGSQLFAALPKTSDGLLDTSALQSDPNFAKMLPDQQEHFLSSIDGYNKVNASFNQQRAEHAAQLANAALEASKKSGQPFTVVDAALWLNGAANAGIATPDEVQHIHAALAQGADPTQLFEAVRGQGTKYKEHQYEPLPTNSPGVLDKATGQITPVAGVTPRITNETELAQAAAGGDAKAKAAWDLAHPAKPPSEEVPVIIRTMENGKPVEKVLPRSEAMGQTFPSQPPASVIYPKPPGAASGDGLTDDAVDYTATAYRLLGTRAIPTRISGQDRAKILNKAAEQSKALGQTPVAATIKQLTTKADSSALAQVEKMASAADGFETKALAQADIISNLSKQLPRTSIPLVNRAIQSGRTEISGDPTATQFANAVSTFAAEYAKIMEGSTGSAAGSSDSARRASDRLISTAMSGKQIGSVLDLMKREMALTLQGYDVAREHINERIGGSPQGAAPPAANSNIPPPGAKIRTFNPATGKLE